MNNDGGSAFPVCPPLDGSGSGSAGGYPFPEGGMSLRDYMAIHTEQPGVTEICAEAGLVCINGVVWDGPDKNLGNFSAWWAGLTSHRRYELNAIVRYRVANAMLKERATS